MTASIQYQPNTYEPVNTTGIWVGLTSSEWTNTDFKYILRVGWYATGSTSLNTLGQYRINPDITRGGLGFFNTANALRSVVNADCYYGVYKYIPSLTGSATQNDSLYGPGYGSTRWGFQFGVEYDPNQFVNKISQISPFNNYALEFASPHGLLLSDTIKLVKTDGTKNTDVNGIATIVSVLSATQCLISKSPFGDVYDDDARIRYHARMMNYQTTELNSYDGIKGATYTYNEVPQTLISYISQPVLSDWDINDIKTIYPDMPEAVSFLSNPSDGNQRVVYNEIRLYTDRSKTTSLGSFSFSTYYSNWATELPLERHWVVSCGHKEVKYLCGASANGANYYEIDLVGSSLTFATIKREVYTGACYDEVWRLAWLNQKGGYDFFDFPKIRRTETQFDRKIFTRSQFWDSNNIYGGSRTTPRQRDQIMNDYVEEWTFQTDWLSEKEYNFLYNLLKSNKVYITNGWKDIDSIDLPSATQPVPLVTPIEITDILWSSKFKKLDKLFNLVLKARKSYKDINHGL